MLEKKLLMVVIPLPYVLSNIFFQVLLSEKILLHKEEGDQEDQEVFPQKGWHEQEVDLIKEVKNQASGEDVIEILHHHLRQVHLMKERRFE